MEENKAPLNRLSWSNLPFRSICISLLLISAGFIVWFSIFSNANSPKFAGTEMDPPREILSFRLTNQHNEKVSSEDFSGKVLVLSFLYTSCVDLCPLTAAKLHQVYSLLGQEVNDVVFLVITVDPERDTVEQVRRYSVQRDMDSKWHFLVGEEEELASLWEYYWVGDIRQDAVGGGQTSSSDTGHEAYKVDHSAPIHIIKGGEVRVVFGNSFLPSELTHDLQVLLQ